MSEKSWKKEMRDLLSGVCGGGGTLPSMGEGMVAGTHTITGLGNHLPPGVRVETGTCTNILPDRSGSYCSGGTYELVEGAQLYGLEGQDFSIFEVGDLVEVVPTIGNDLMRPYLPVTDKKVGPNKRSTLFHLDGVKRGMVVRKGKKGTREMFEESRMGRNDQFAFEMSREIEERGVRHGESEVLEILLGEEEIVIEVLSSRCDPSKSLVIRKMREE